MKVWLGEQRSLVVCLSAEEEEEEAEEEGEGAAAAASTGKSSERRWSATALADETGCASWRCVSAWRPCRYAQPGFTPTIGRSGSAEEQRWLSG